MNVMALRIGWLRWGGGIIAITQLVACGSSGSGPSRSDGNAPVIASQPTDASIPMGLAVSFSVVAHGENLRFQWLREAQPISGATAATYTSPPVAYADTNAHFSVQVANGAGQVQSWSATLTVTAQAPIAGDLRFNQVDSSAILQGGNGAGTSSALIYNIATEYGDTVGSTLWLSDGDCAVNDPAVTACAWGYLTYAASTLTTGYAAAPLDVFETPSSNVGATPNWQAPGNVINSLDIRESQGLVGMSYVRDPAADAFHANRIVVDGNSVATAIAEEGSAGRVVTALSAAGGSIVFMSYAWDGDHGTAYDTSVQTTDTAGVGAAVQALAGKGYIVTAIGRTSASGALMLVGTRIHGPDWPRPVVVASSADEKAALFTGGYALVSVYEPASGPVQFIGER